MLTLEQKITELVEAMQTADLCDDDERFYAARESLDSLRESKEYKEKYGDSLYPDEYVSRD